MRARPVNILLFTVPRERPSEFALDAELGGLLGCGAVRLSLLDQLGHAVAILAPNEIDCSAVDDGEDPGAAARAPMVEGSSRSIDVEHALDERVLRKVPVDEHAESQPIGSTVEAPVELGEGGDVAERDPLQERLVVIAGKRRLSESVRLQFRFPLHRYFRRDRGVKKRYRR
jgi:hypothetical protein